MGDDGKLLPEAEKVLQVLSAHPDVILSGGHIGAEELWPLVHRAREMGITRIWAEHPNGRFGYSDEDIVQMVQAGVTLDMLFNPANLEMSGKDPIEVVRVIRLAGVERCTMMTDAGLPFSPTSHEGMRVFREMLPFTGFSVDEIFTTSKKNPAKLLGLPD